MTAWALLRTTLLTGLVAATPLAAVRAAPATEQRRAAVLEALTLCRKDADSARRLACYDKAAGALDEAEAKGQVVVLDRDQVRTVKRQAFGLSLPSISLFSSRPGGDERVDRVTYALKSAVQGGDGKWVFQTVEGASWVQTDDERLGSDPHAGSQMLVRHGALSSYFCKVDGQLALRCQRRN